MAIRIDWKIKIWCWRAEKAAGSKAAGAGWSQIRNGTPNTRNRLKDSKIWKTDWTVRY